MEEMRCIIPTIKEMVCTHRVEREREREYAYIEEQENERKESVHV